MKSSQLILFALILLVCGEVKAWHHHCAHHHLHGHHVHSNHHHHHEYYGHHHHINERTIHGHMTNVAPSASSVISPDIGKLFF